MPTPKKFPFKMGADPEFNLIIDNQHFCASALFNDMFTNKLPAGDMGYIVENAGEIGWDGNDDIAEIRPKPGDSPEEVTNNIKKLISTITEHNPLLELSTLSDMGTVGGHIHFELPNCQSRPNGASMESLSRKLGSFYLPIIMSEDKLNLRTRGRSSYGKLTDYRAEQHNEAYTFEFRAPSAEWLTSEEITKATLAYLGTIYNEIIYHPRNFNKCGGILFKNQNQAQALKDLVISEYSIMKTLTGKIKKYIQTFEFYPQYKKEIDFILSTDKVSKIKQKVDFNMALGWNLTKYKQPTKRQLFSRINAKTETTDLDKLTKLLKLDYNSDTNVAEFANALKTKIARFNWKMNNKYFLFGLKKGITDFIITNKNLEFIAGEKQIQTTNDLYCIQETFKRMSGKFPYNKNGRQDKLTTELNRQYILIGIPYEQRISQNTKPLLETIYNLEKNLPQAKHITERLPQTINIERTLNGKKETIPSEGIIAELYNTSSDKELPISDPRRMDQAQNDLQNAESELINEENNN